MSLRFIMDGAVIFINIYWTSFTRAYRLKQVNYRVRSELLMFAEEWERKHICDFNPAQSKLGKEWNGCHNFTGFIKTTKHGKKEIEILETEKEK